MGFKIARSAIPQTRQPDRLPDTLEGLGRDAELRAADALGGAITGIAASLAAKARRNRQDLRNQQVQGASVAAGESERDAVFEAEETGFNTFDREGGIDERTNEILQRLDDRASTALEGIDDERARKIAEGIFKNQRVRAAGRVQRTLLGLQDDHLQETQEGLRRMIARNVRSLEDVDGAYEQILASEPGLTDAGKAALLDAIKTTAVEAEADTNPKEFLADLKAGEFKDVLDASTVRTLRDRATTRLRRKDAEEDRQKARAADALFQKSVGLVDKDPEGFLKSGDPEGVTEVQARSLRDRARVLINRKRADADAEKDKLDRERFESAVQAVENDPNAPLPDGLNALEKRSLKDRSQLILRRRKADAEGKELDRKDALQEQAIRQIDADPQGFLDRKETGEFDDTFKPSVLHNLVAMAKSMVSREASEKARQDAIVAVEQTEGLIRQVEGDPSGFLTRAAAGEFDSLDPSELRQHTDRAKLLRARSSAEEARQETLAAVARTETATADIGEDAGRWLARSESGEFDDQFQPSELQSLQKSARSRVAAEEKIARDLFEEDLIDETQRDPSGILVGLASGEVQRRRAVAGVPPLLPSEIQTAKDRARKLIKLRTEMVEEAATQEMNENPVAFLKKLDGGGYNKIVPFSVRLKLREQAQDVLEELINLQVDADPFKVADAFRSGDVAKDPVAQLLDPDRLINLRERAETEIGKQGRELRGRVEKRIAGMKAAAFSADQIKAAGGIAPFMEAALGVIDETQRLLGTRQAGEAYEYKERFDRLTTLERQRLDLTTFSKRVQQASADLLDGGSDLPRGGHVNVAIELRPRTAEVYGSLDPKAIQEMVMQDSNIFGYLAGFHKARISQMLLSGDQGMKAAAEGVLVHTFQRLEDAFNDGNAEGASGAAKVAGGLTDSELRSRAQELAASGGPGSPPPRPKLSPALEAEIGAEAAVLLAALPDKFDGMFRMEPEVALAAREAASRKFKNLARTPGYTITSAKATALAWIEDNAAAPVWTTEQWGANQVTLHPPQKEMRNADRFGGKLGNIPEWEIAESFWGLVSAEVSWPKEQMVTLQVLDVNDLPTWQIFRRDGDQLIPEIVQGPNGPVQMLVNMEPSDVYSYSQKFLDESMEELKWINSRLASAEGESRAAIIAQKDAIEAEVQEWGVNVLRTNMRIRGDLDVFQKRIDEILGEKPETLIDLARLRMALRFDNIEKRRILNKIGLSSVDQNFPLEDEILDAAQRGATDELRELQDRRLRLIRGN